MSQFKKFILLGIAGFLLGFGIAVFLVALKDILSSKVGSPFQAAICTGLMPSVYNLGSHQNKAVLNSLWLGLANNYAATGARKILFLSSGTKRGEKAFWDAFVAMAASRGFQMVLIEMAEEPLDPTPGGVPMPKFNGLRPEPVSRIEISPGDSSTLQHALNAIPTSHAMIFRTDLSIDSENLPTLNIFDSYFLVASTMSTTSSKLRETAALLEQNCGSAQGVILLDKQKPGIVTKIGAALQQALLDQSRGDAPVDSPLGLPAN